MQWIPSILIVDDEELIYLSLESALLREGYHVLWAANGQQALQCCRETLPDLVLLDIVLPDANGMELMLQMADLQPQLPILLMTAYGSIPAAVRAMRQGAHDFISKPFKLEEVRKRVRNALEPIRLRKEIEHLREALKQRYGFDNLIGASPPMLKVFEMVQRIARHDTTTVLLEGESGTGKELIARAIHYQSRRSDRPFIEINCSILPDSLLENELLGHEKGAFTDAKSAQVGLFEQAHGGTLFLDEIGEMKLEMQSKLLRLIKEKRIRRGGERKDIPVDVRIVAATSRPLEKLVQEGRFREDLYYRLKVFPISLPPLRERREDIPLLIRFFIDRFNRSFGRSVKGITKGALEALQAYSWPGNVWELRNVIERAMILAQGEELDLEDLPLELVENSKLPPQQMVVQLPPDGVSLELVERELIRQALERTRGNQTHAARLLHLHRLALRHRMEKYGLLPAIHSYRRLKRENGLPRPNSKPGTRGSQ